MYLQDEFLELGLLSQKVNAGILLLDIAKFHKSCTSLPSHQQYMEVSVSPWPAHLNVLSDFLKSLQIRLCEKWYLTVVLISISCIVSELKHIFKCLRPFLHIKNYLLGFIILRFLKNFGEGWKISSDSSKDSKLRD